LLPGKCVNSNHSSCVTFETFNLTRTTNAVQHTLSIELERRTLQTGL